ncbi:MULTISPECIES: aldose epimerase family protein [unclassified Aureimonas]|uniref:aldose epimerase family protein n=1 Tax=unclassified Aureimonas TaxID=2615206 RepID=UPI0006F2166F|nr:MULTISPECIES: aldose epimerase family protein [unclassified Aureimonas]KQT64101.1 hypothetical protein ASG62_03585 [Aureimonas sp. Leaf427]KQT81291.1 hypothetical protein ASG54_00855 [Aureimonas sp. Leaf460]
MTFDQPALDILRIGSADGLAVEILPLGASVRSIRLGGGRSLALGAADLGLYGPANRSFLGASIGRHANRIADARFALGSERFEVSANEPPHHLHGGTTGAWSRIWTVEEESSDGVILSLLSRDGEDGYPGAAEMTAAFSIENGDTLKIVYEGRVDRPSILGMTSHLYFNLSGEASTQGHRIEIAADAYLPVGETLIPTGEVRPVDGTPFDFRAAKPLADGPDMLDHNFCFGRERHTEPQRLATLSSEAGGIALHVLSTECGLQVYDGAKFDGTIEGLDGGPIQPHGGIALEPQGWPDAPNRPDFPSARIEPGQTYRHTILYRFQRLG